MCVVFLRLWLLCKNTLYGTANPDKGHEVSHPMWDKINRLNNDGIYIPLCNHGDLFFSTPVLCFSVRLGARAKVPLKVPSVINIVSPM